MKVWAGCVKTWTFNWSSHAWSAHHIVNPPSFGKWNGVSDLAHFGRFFTVLLRDYLMCLSSYTRIAPRSTNPLLPHFRQHVHVRPLLGTALLAVHVAMEQTSGPFHSLKSYVEPRAISFSVFEVEDKDGRERHPSRIKEPSSGSPVFFRILLTLHVPSSPTSCLIV